MEKLSKDYRGGFGIILLGDGKKRPTIKLLPNATFITALTFVLCTTRIAFLNYVLSYCDCESSFDSLYLLDKIKNTTEVGLYELL